MMVSSSYELTGRGFVATQHEGELLVLRMEEGSRYCYCTRVNLISNFNSINYLFDFMTLLSISKC